MAFVLDFIGNIFGGSTRRTGVLATAKQPTGRDPAKVTNRPIPRRRTLGSVPGFSVRPSSGGAGGVSVSPVGGTSRIGTEALTATLGQQGYKSLLGN
ncbi:MAG: hypothetical protein Q8P46_00475 [Hyphomicrobiales bacterium]|nr:hypothetical protein [Hyphomicrobiales bacterium]